jgi:uncharacterized protein (TIGR03118 family)
MWRSIFAALAALVVGTTLTWSASLNSYIQTNLVSDLPGFALNQDTNLVNPWGIVQGPTPFWISDNHAGVATIYDGTGKALSLVVTIPPAAGSSGPGAPTGVVFNLTASFGGAKFIFAGEDGSISAWKSGTAAVLEATSPAAGSVYKGLALGSNGLLYATNFGVGRVDVYDGNFKPTTVSGGFTDPNLPAGYAPFDIKEINGKLYVTYALQNADKMDDVAGAGHGFIDVFDLNGNMMQRLISKGALNSPWGLAVAPSGFGALGGDLLVGNFGDGKINAYYASTGSLLATLHDTNGKPVSIDGLWGLDFGNGSANTNVDTLYFTAGIAGPGMKEDHGLYGSLIPGIPEPRSVGLLAVGLVGMLFIAVRGRRFGRAS